MAAAANAEAARERGWPAAPPPACWLAAAVLGLGARAFLVVATEGTLDVEVWAGHAREILDRGLVAYYRGGAYQFNHPPLAGLAVTGLWRLAEATGLPFAALLRAPIALGDVASVALLWRVLAGRRGRGWWAIALWLHPLAWILSGYHGNTDALLPPFLLAAVLATAARRPGTAGLALGLSLWIKLPGALAALPLLAAFGTHRERLRFAASAAGVAAAGFAPALWQDPEAVVRAVFLYSPLRIQTTGGEPIWGLLGFLPSIGELPVAWRAAYRAAVQGLLGANNAIVLAAVAWLSFCHRGAEPRSAALAARVAAAYTLVYGLTNFWAFQYFAWALPFWAAAGWRFALPASLLATGYVYGYYAWLCGDLLLRGEWDFVGHPLLPWWLLVLRNAATLFFFVVAVRELCRATARLRPRDGDPRGGSGADTSERQLDPPAGGDEPQAAPGGVELQHVAPRPGRALSPVGEALAELRGARGVRGVHPEPVARA